MIQIKRIYEAPAKGDGYRILVDRLWPRGVSKEHAALDEWVKEVAPSSELRIWFNHDPKKFDEFARRYEMELNHNPSVDAFLKRLKQNHTTTLLYGAKDTHINHAVVLKEFLKDKL